MITNPTKKLVDDKVPKDRLSNLPRHLIDSIVDYLPVDDAARTCTLSKTWRNIWIMHPHIVLDHAFFTKHASKGHQQHTVVDLILLLHIAPILKFHLYIPPHFYNTPSIDAWLKRVYSKGVRNLKLINSEQNTPYQIPSSLFSCSQLTELSLTNCVLTPLHKFGGFPNLIIVQLVNVSITSDMSLGTRVRTLKLSRCIGIEHLGCQFSGTNSLRDLVINECKEMDWQWFEFLQNMYTFVLALNPVSIVKRRITLHKLLVNMPDLNSIWLNGSTLQCLEPGPKRLATTMDNLQNLQLYNLELSDISQITNAFCLIRSSPNLQKLLIQLEPEATSRNQFCVQKPEATSTNQLGLTIESDLESPDCLNIVLDQLQTIKIYGVAGSRAELLLIKFLLASSSSLKTIMLSRRSNIFDPKLLLKIAQKLIRFPRTSSEAEMIWTY